MQPQSPQHRVLFHFMSEGEASQKSLLSNISNLLAVWPDAEIEVVAHGPGISLLLRDEVACSAELASLAGKASLRFVVCENTLRHKGISPTALLTLAETVPVAIAELVMKQEQGWSYIRAGV